LNTFNTSDLVGSNHFTTEEAKKIGESLGVDWSKFDVEQFRMGLDVELEHGISDLQTNVTNDNEMITGKIALAHLNEFPDYYTRLEKMEREAKESHDRKYRHLSVERMAPQTDVKDYFKMCKGFTRRRSPVREKTIQ
jgi:hypothetical protein